MPGIDWRSFWNSYRKKEITSEDDLFIEVGKTVLGRPITPDQFRRTTEQITGLLRLSPDDKLLELCCGNGLMTRALAPLVAKAEAVDFSAHLITHARERTGDENVRYVCADAIEHLETLVVKRSFIPTKVLLGEALAYFDPTDLHAMLERISRLTTNDFVFLATGVPCDELKWNFYNTPERQERYAQNQQRTGNTNDGLGRWWTKDELRKASEGLKIESTVFELSATSSEYRVDVLYRAPATRT